MNPLQPSVGRAQLRRLPPHVGHRRAVQSLLDLGNSTRRGVMCSHRESAYADVAHPPLPRSDEAQDRCLLLPMYASIDASREAALRR